MKRITLIFLFVSLVTYLPIKAQYAESKERKKMWKKSFKRRKNRAAFNPYLDKKTKPSEKLNKQNAKEIKRMNKAARKQKRSSMKKLGIKETKVKKAK